jgi:hypothetical protein
MSWASRAREHQIHPRVRGEDRERDLFRRIAVLSGDGLEGRRVGDLLALIWFDDVARRAVLLGLTFSVVGVGGKGGPGGMRRAPWIPQRVLLKHTVCGLLKARHNLCR